MPKARKADEQPFPLVEAFGYAVDADTRQAREACEQRFCRFTGGPCEKFKQYHYGYCSLTYAAEDDERVRWTYAVCDHRLDGEPVQAAVKDHFGEAAGRAKLVPEVVLKDRKKSLQMSFDYVAITVGPGREITDAVAIETQTIDIRGGGVGPAWKAWMERQPERWREYFSAEAKVKSRRDDVAYGINRANIYKRLGLQVAAKGSYLRSIGVPLYVVMQHKPFEYLRRRIPFSESADPWDITFITFDYTGQRGADGTLEFKQAALVRTSLASYVQGLTAAGPSGDRAYFLGRVKRKARLAD